MFKNLKQMNSLISEMKKLTNDPEALKNPQAMMESMGIDQEELEKQLSGLLSKKATLKFTKINEDAVTPKYNYDSDSGFDLHSCVDTVVPANGRVLVPTGLILKFDESSEIQIRPKSGLALNHGLTVLNTPGTVDQGYTGEIQVIVFNTNNYTVQIPKGMKVGQAVLCPVVNGKFVKFEQVNQLEDKDRGDNGFGSTGI